MAARSWIIRMPIASAAWRDAICPLSCRVWMTSTVLENVSPKARISAPPVPNCQGGQHDGSAYEERGKYELHDQHMGQGGAPDSNLQQLSGVELEADSEQQRGYANAGEGMQQGACVHGRLVQQETRRQVAHQGGESEPAAGDAAGQRYQDSEDINHLLLGPGADFSHCLALCCPYASMRQVRRGVPRLYYSG